MISDPTLQTLHEAAKLALKEHRFQDALHHLERAIAHAPDDVMAYTMTGIAHQRLGHNELALRAFRQAVHHDPNDPVAHFNLGQMFHIAGDDESAVECLMNCIAVDPNHQSAKTLLNNIQSQLAGPIPPPQTGNSASVTN